MAWTSDIFITEIKFSDRQNIEIFLNQKTTFKSYILHNPERLAIDINGASMASNALISDFPSFISGFKSSQSGKNIRLVFDLRRKVVVNSSVFQKLKKQKNSKILVKISVGELLENKENQVMPQDKLLKTQQQEDPLGELIDKNQDIKYVIKTENDEQSRSRARQNNEADGVITTIRNPIIVIDAGHGGKDPGTIGDYARTKEKNITLSYARELRKSLLATKNYQIYLIRDKDAFVSLRGRVQKARHLNADLFISLHANSAADSGVSGLSIYTLSEKSSDKQAELLAQKENRADIIAGINFDNTSGDVLKTLIDLSQRSSMNSSSHFANIAIKSSQKVGIEILQNTHRFAGFAVLTAPDIASVLIELGYLSNKEEEKKLNSLFYKRLIIKGLTDAVNEYFRKNGE